MSVNLSDTTPPAPAGYVLAKPQANGSGQVSIAVPDGSTLGAVLLSPSGDQVITAHDLTIRKGLNASAINSILYVDGVTYPTIADALAALPAVGGTVVCPDHYRETITSPITLGNGTTSSVLLVLGYDVVLTVNITGGASSAFVVNESSGIVGSSLGSLGASRTGASVISLASTCDIINVITTGDDPQATIILRNFYIDNVNAGAVSNAFVYLLNLNDGSIIENVRGAYCPNYGLLIAATTGGVKTVGPLVINDCWFNGTSLTNAKPFAVTSDGSGTTNNILVLGGYYLNPGSGLPCVTLDGNGGTTGTLQQITFIGVYTQSTSTSTGVIGFSIIDAAGITIGPGCSFQVAGSVTSGHTGILIDESGSGRTHSIDVLNFRLDSAGGNAGVLNNITSETLLTSSGNTNYHYQGTSGTQLPTPVVIGGDSQLQVGGYDGSDTATLRVNGVAHVVTSVDTPLVNFGTAQGKATGGNVTVLSASTVDVGVTSNSGMWLFRDTANGGTAVVIFDNTGAVTIVSQTGTTVFVTGAPAATQIQITSVSAQMKLQGGSSRNNVLVFFWQISAQN